MRRLEGGCQVPIAAHATIEHDMLRLRGMIGLPDGSQMVAGERRSSTGDAEALGIALAEMLLAEGGDAILERLSRVVPAIEAPEGTP